jgi:glycerol uptake facilitator-like aquaporin
MCIHTSRCIGVIKLERHAEQLAALGHVARLSLLRTVVQAGPEGISTTDLQEQLDIPWNHHLDRLVDARLVTVRREGKFAYHTADYEALRGVTDFLWEDLANTLATGAGLVALILTFGSISGAHFNPAVTLADASQGGLPWKEVPVYIVSQVLGAFGGVAVAHVMFDKPVFFASTHGRSGVAQMVGEFVATFGLLAVVWGCARRRPTSVPFAVGAYITAAYWFTSSTSFANPAVTLARAATDTFAGIRPVDVPGFVVAQLLGAAAATVTFRWLLPSLPSVAEAGDTHPTRST